MTDRELLAKLASFIASRLVIEGDEASIRDMVSRYANPPLTLHYRRAMRLTVNEHKNLQILLVQINEHLKPEAVEENICINCGEIIKSGEEHTPMYIGTEFKSCIVTSRNDEHSFPAIVYPQVNSGD